MKSTLRLFALLALTFTLAACSSSAEYPDVKTNVKMGQPKARSNYTLNRNNSQQDHGSLIRTEDAPGGGQSVCVGSWCSCGSE